MRRRLDADVELTALSRIPQTSLGGRKTLHQGDETADQPIGIIRVAGHFQMRFMPWVSGPDIKREYLAAKRFNQGIQRRVGVDVEIDVQETGFFRLYRF